MKISVVIPALNEERYIETMLYHVKKLRPYEIIVADSYSTDKTAQIAKKFGAKVVRCPKKNASIGRNAGGRKARGDIILFLDADGIVFPNMLEVIKKDFKDKGVAGWTCCIYGFTPKWSEQILYNMANQLISFLTTRLKKPHAAGICIAVRRDVFNRLNGFNESLKVMEDHEFADRTGKYGKFIFSKETCVFTSARRIQDWGGLNLIRKYSKIYLQYHLNKNADYQNVDYEPIR